MITFLLILGLVGAFCFAHYLVWIADPAGWQPVSQNEAGAVMQVYIVLIEQSNSFCFFGIAETEYNLHRRAES